MFTGFTDETVDFMWGIRFNNERSWFEAHKDIYLTQFYQPMKELGAEMYDFIREKRPDYGLISKTTRIYRDARRLHGRGPYKDSLWFSVEQPSEQWTAHPTLWFELSPDGWTCGMGYYMPKPVTMAKLRARIDRDPGTMEALTRRLNGQQELTLETEDYKRPRAAAPQRPSAQTRASARPARSPASWTARAGPASCAAPPRPRAPPPPSAAAPAAPRPAARGAPRPSPRAARAAPRAPPPPP